MDKSWLCDFAWKCLFVNSVGQVSFCPTNTFPRGSLVEASLDRIWNGPQFQKARAQVAERRYLEARCLPTCPWLIAGIPSYASYFANPPPAIDEAAEDARYQDQLVPAPPVTPVRSFLDNLEVVAGDILAESTIASGMPTRAHIEIIESCNLGCRFCDVGVRRPKERVIDDLILDRLRPAYRYLEEVEFLGGEIFSTSVERSPLWRILADLEAATAGNPAKTRVILITNGIGLNQQWVQALTSMTNLHLIISISIDTLDPDHYEQMRVGGRIARLLANIRYLRQAVDQAGAAVDLLFSSVVCLKTYKNIPDLVNFAQEMRALYVLLQPLQATGDLAFFEENNLFRSGNSERLLYLRDALNRIPWESFNRDNIVRICDEYLA
jgi:MoaA/NifB/PqqE/SkfB family radical SAM enzyme